jgi:hypothetical protein
MSVPGKRFLRSAFKYLVIGLAAAMLIGIVMLKWVERSPDQLEVGFESYLTQISGYPADIGTLNDISFFPQIIMDMTDIRFWAIDDPDKAMIEAGRVTVRVSLWSVMVGMPRFSALMIEGARFDSAITGTEPVLIDALAIDEARSALTLSGQAGEVRIDALVPLTRTMGGAYRLSSLPVRTTMTLNGPGLAGEAAYLPDRGQRALQARFSTYDADTMRPVQRLLERWAARGDLPPIQLDIEAMRGMDGPVSVPALRLENGALQPLECFYNNRNRTSGVRDACLR